MAYQNTVRGMQCRNITGNVHGFGTGGYWECGNALVQLAQLVSRVTVNQMEMAEHEYNIASQLNGTLNTQTERLSSIQNNQVILDQKLNTLIQNQQTLSAQLGTLVETLQAIQTTLTENPQKTSASPRKRTGSSAK